MNSLFYFFYNILTFSVLYATRVFLFVYNFLYENSVPSLYKIRTEELDGCIYTTYSYNKSNEFIIVNSDNVPSREYVLQSNYLRYNIIFVSIEKDDFILDVTSDVRKFVCYMSDNDSLHWKDVLSYCLRDYRELDDYTISIHYNDDDMTLVEYTYMELETSLFNTNVNTDLNFNEKHYSLQESKYMTLAE